VTVETTGPLVWGLIRRHEERLDEGQALSDLGHRKRRTENRQKVNEKIGNSARGSKERLLKGSELGR